MKRIMVGIDVGSATHRIVGRGENGELLYEKEVKHEIGAIEEMIGELEELRGDGDTTIEIGLEGRNGYSRPMDRMLLEHGFKVHSVDNMSVKQFRSVFGADSKTDKRDAEMMSKLIRLKGDINAGEGKAIKEIKENNQVNEKIKIIARHQAWLIKEKVRTIEILEKTILEVSPEFLKEMDLTGKTAIEILARYPDFSKYKNLSETRLRKIDGVGAKKAESLAKRLQVIKYDGYVIEEYTMMIKSYAKRIKELVEEIEKQDKRLEELGKESVDVQLLISMPGVGIRTAARIVGEIERIERFKSERNLAAYSGVIPLNNESGKHKGTKMIYKCNKRLKNTLIQMAGNTIRYVPEAKTYYDKKIAEGKKHNHALRCLARQLIKVIFKMLTEHRKYRIFGV